MTQYIPYAAALAALAALIAVGWYCRRWGIADGEAQGYERGRLKGLLEGPGMPHDPVLPSLSGGPREPA